MMFDKENNGFAMNNPIVLQCSKCGGRLDITPDMEMFACGYCGTPQIVRRVGNTISLKQIGEDVAGVKAATDRIATELRIRRLRDDLAVIQKEREQLCQLHTQTVEEINKQHGGIFVTIVLV